MRLSEELRAEASEKLEKQEKDWIHPVLAKNFGDRTLNNAGKIKSRIEMEKMNQRESGQ